MSIDRRVRYGMVGGGPGAFIGGVHRAAAALDRECELVAGSFSSNAERSAAQGRELNLDPARVYGTYDEMAQAEAALPENERIDFVSIVTPNFLHHPVAKTFLDAGFHVVCDKPLTTTLDDAEDLCDAVTRSGSVFALTHNYTGYPMVKEARAWVRAGRVGEIRRVVVEYAQGWLHKAIEASGQKQASWRQDPERAGISSALGDIGTHAENLTRYVTGLEMDELLADLTSFVSGRTMEDDANLLIHFHGGAHGVLSASQIALGEENNLSLRVYGTEGALEWHQENPNQLLVRSADRPLQVLTPGHPFLSDAARHATRLPAGHPEGFIEAFANLYRNAARTMRARDRGEEPDPLDLDFPTVQDGAVGVHFIHQAVESWRERRWVSAAYEPPS
jgi:predicted dehydrogenase